MVVLELELLLQQVDVVEVDFYVRAQAPMQIWRGHWNDAYERSVALLSRICSD
jgi:hypothetical protein